jgi:hypothetical protein
MCQECLDEHKSWTRKPNIGTCEWCKTPDVEVKSTRDYEEGMAGRLYDVCAPCRKKVDDEARAELDAMDAGWDYDDYEA